jgi:xanthine dehydrogenase accessory factor
VFVEVIRPPATLVVVGGTQIAVALTSIARTLAYRTILIDPRSTWANAARFPHLDQLIASWPDAAFQQIEVTNRTAIVALTHDRKLDDPTLCIALQGPAFYVGALGSRRTHEDRRRRLLALGLTEEQVSRLHAPIGLEIGAETPEEIALAIMAEIIAAARLHGEPQPRPEPALASTS